MSQIGWRLWRLSGQTLISLWYPAHRYPQSWSLEPLRAECWGPGHHVVPASSSRFCLCGFYVFDDPARALDLHMHGDHWVYRQAAVIGCVEWWGENYVHEFGHRVEYAQIRGLVPLDGAVIPPAYDQVRADSLEQLVARWAEPSVRS